MRILNLTCGYFNSVWMQGMDRRQQMLDLLLIPLDNFCETYSSSTSSPSGSTDHSWKSPYSRTVSPLQVTLIEYLKKLKFQ